MPATPDQIPTDLTLEIGENLSPERFMTAARAFFGYVEEISRTLATDDEPLRWVVRIREGSALLGVDPAQTTPPEIARTMYARAERGILHLIARDIENSGLPEPALKHLRTLSEMTETGVNKGLPVPLRLWVEKKPISFEPAIASAIREDERSDYSDYGTVEGRLETIQESRGNLQLYVRDALLHQKVRCFFLEEMLPEVFDNFRRRVEVSGIIHYRRNGTPISIAVEKIIRLPDDSELPTAEDVRGILSN